MTYKPRITKSGPFYLVDKHLPYPNPLSVKDAKLRRLAWRWCSKKNVEWVNRVIPSPCLNKSA